MQRRERTASLRVLRLPVNLTFAALQTIMDAVAAGPSAGQWVFDFCLTRHIQFKALQELVRRLQTLGPFPRPIILAGLTPYCEEIVYFALQSRDWDLFIEVSGDGALPAPGGNDGGSECVLGWSGESADEGASAPFCWLCPN
jgi:hypothetical protein